MKNILITMSIGALLSFPAMANGLKEDGSWRFDDPVTKQYKLNAELAQQKMKAGGFKQVFNVTADGSSPVYVGNNTYVENQQTNVANQSVVDIIGSDNSVSVGQALNNSSQSNTTNETLNQNGGS